MTLDELNEALAVVVQELKDADRDRERTARLRSVISDSESIRTLDEIAEYVIGQARLAVELVTEYTESVA